MIYTNLNVNCIRLIETCGNLTFENELRHPNRTLPHHDLVYVKKGGFNVIVENELIQSREGDIMFLPAYKYHHSNEDNLENSSCYYIHFTPNDKDFIKFEKGALNNDFYCIPSKINIKHNSNLVAYFHEITALGPLEIKENTKLLNSILSRIFSEIDLLVHDQNGFRYDELTTNVIALLMENVDKKISINDLAEKLNFSPRTIQKHFKDDTGKTIHDYHLQLKLNKSKYFIVAYPNMSIKEIANRLGFYDEFHYSKAFKKSFGLSPTQYKKK